MIRTFIYGSCVSRDTFEFLDPSHFSLLRYVARSSLVSAFSQPGELPFVGEQDLLTLFQRRQLHTDVSSGLLALLRTMAEEIDLLMWDLVDERLGFYDDGAGRVITDSIELRKVASGANMGNYKHYAFGSRAHLARFGTALREWREFLHETDLLDRLVIVAPHWAEIDTSGAASPASFGITGLEGNRLYRPYYRDVKQIFGVPLIGHDLETRTDQGHRWGPAPFHYSTETYVALRDRMMERVGDRL